MELIIDSSYIKKLSGSLWQGCGYTIKPRRMPDGTYRHFTSRISPPPFIGYDPMHWEFIKMVVMIADKRREPFLRDVRISLRELAAAEYDAHHFRGKHWTKDEYKPWIKRVAVTLQLRYKHNIKPSTRLNAQQAQRVINFLERRDEGLEKLKCLIIENVF